MRARPGLIQGWFLVTLTAMWLQVPLSAHAASKLAGVQKMVYVSEFGITVAGPSDWYGTVQAESPTGRSAYPEWPPTRRAMYVKYDDAEADKRAFNPALVIEMMTAEGGESPLEYLRANANMFGGEPGVSVLEAPAEQTIKGQTWATYRLRVLMDGDEKGGTVVIQQWYATVHGPVFLLIVGGSTEEEFGQDGALFDRAIEGTTFSSHGG